MADKIIDIDPSKRLSKEALDKVRAKINELDAEELESLVIIYTPKRKTTNLIAYGLTFYSLGMATTMLSTLGQTLLREEFNGFQYE